MYTMNNAKSKIENFLKRNIFKNNMNVKKNRITEEQALSYASMYPQMYYIFSMRVKLNSIY